MGRHKYNKVGSHRRRNKRDIVPTHHSQDKAGDPMASYWRTFNKCFSEVAPHRDRDAATSKHHRHLSPRSARQHKSHVPYHFQHGRNHTSKVQRKTNKVHRRRHKKRMKASSGIRKVHHQKWHKYEVFPAVEVSSPEPSEEGTSTVELKKKGENVKNSFQTSSILSSFVDQDAIEIYNETTAIYSENDVEMNKPYTVQGEMLKDDCCGGGGCGSGCGVCPGYNRPPSCGYHTFLKEFIKANCKLSRCEAIKNAKCIYAGLPECTRKLWRRRGCCKRREVCKRRKCCGPCDDEFILEDEQPEDILSELGIAIDKDLESSNTFVADPADFGIFEEEAATLLETRRTKYKK